MTNKEIYREYLEQLQQIYPANEAAVITGWVFEKIAGLQRGDIIKNPGENPHSSILKHLNDCLEALLTHKPVQYVLGEAWFCNMKLKVNEQVLIPRPETEELIQLVVDTWQAETGKAKLMKNNPASRANIQMAGAGQLLSVLDIGTGSGCIAIAIKKKLPISIISAIDISPGALSVAKENAADQQTAIEFLQADFLDQNNWKTLPVFDIIISNPPYIPFNEKDKLDKNVAGFEPHTALFVPDNEPLLFYKKIADFGKEHLKKDGKIYVEIHEDFAKATREVFEQFYNVEIKKDMFGKDRMLMAYNTSLFI